MIMDLKYFSIILIFKDKILFNCGIMEILDYSCFKKNRIKYFVVVILYFDNFDFCLFY